MITNRTVFSLFVTICFLAASSARSQSWAPQETTTPTHFSSVDFIDDNTGWACGTSGVLYKTTDGGAHWVLKPTGTSATLSDLRFINSSIGWAVGQNGVIIKTVDGGNTWTPQTSGTTAALNGVYLLDAQIGWAVGASGTLIKTTNGGTAWTAQSSGTTATIQTAWFTSLTSAFLGCNDGTLQRTTTGGAVWQTQFLNQPLPLNDLFFVSSSLGWAVGANGRIKKTVNGGESWFIQDGGTAQQLNGVYFPHADTGWVVGDGGLVKWTTNGGTTWTTQISGTTQNLRNVKFISTRHGYAVGNNNTIIEFAIVHSLPIQLASFTAVIVNNHTVRLNWRTISEVNNYGFEVQRATGSPENFVTLAGSFVPGHGTTNEPQNYTWTDNSAQAGRLYYRLKQMDLDGSINYTEPISVDVLTGVEENALPTEFSLKQNYPNPFNPSTNIEFDIAKAGFVSLKVYDVLGREVATIVNEQLNQGNYARTFSGDGLSSGVYWYTLTAGSFSNSKKFILSK